MGLIDIAQDNVNTLSVVVVLAVTLAGAVTTAVLDGNATTMLFVLGDDDHMDESATHPMVCVPTLDVAVQLNVADPPDHPVNEHELAAVPVLYIPPTLFGVVAQLNENVAPGETEAGEDTELMVSDGNATVSPSRFGSEPSAYDCESSRSHPMV